jgi:SAM-dependent methyltransferase
MVRGYKKMLKYFSKVKKVSKEKGIYYVINSVIKRSLNWLKISFWYYYYKIFKSRETFTFEGKTYHYFYHKYNTTWRNERAVEIPIIWKIVKEYYNDQKRILEIGNVLSHYFTVNHTIVDKYEKRQNVINEDVINFQSPKKYDLIISISTLEHIGWDMGETRNPIKILQAIENCRNCLSPSGKMVVTLPLGYNPILDKLLKNGKIKFSKQYYLKRISQDNKWKETEWNECHNEKYDFTHHSAKVLIIGIYYNKYGRL